MRRTFIFKKQLIPSILTVLILLTICFKQSYSQQQLERVYANSVQKSADQNLLVIRAGYVENQNNAVDGNTSTFATLNSTVVQVAFITIGGEASIRLRFTGPNKPLPNTPVTIKLGVGGNLLTALSGLTVQAVNGAGNANNNNGNEVGPVYTGTSLVNLLSGKNQIEFTITPTQPYDGVKIKLGDTGGLLSADVLSTLDVYHAYFLKPTTSNIVCESVVDSLYGSTGILVGGLNPVSNPSNAFDKNDNTFATLRTNVSALNSTFLTGVYSSLSKPGDSIRLVLQQEGTGLLDATLLSAIRVQTFNNNSLLQNFTLNSSLLNLRLLGGSTNKYVLTLPTTTAFNRIRVSIGDGLVNALAGLRVYEMSKTAPKPVVTVPGLINGTLTACEGAPINLTIANPEANATYKWFDAAENGNEITAGVSNNGTTFNPQNLTPGTYNYYVALYRAGCSDAASERTRITIIITPGSTAADITASGTEICVGNTATIAAPTLANASITNPVFRWYLDADRTTPITNGMVDGAVTYTFNPNQSLSISGLTITRNYYISVSGDNICENAPGNLKSVTVTVNTIEQPTLDLSGNQTIGTGGTLTLTATSSNATSYQWYKNGLPIAGAVNNTYTITNATALDAGDYTVVALGLSCSSVASTAVTINVGGFGSTKSVTGLVDGKINAGSELTYTITVSNTGSTDLTGVTITDDIPAGTSYLAGSADNGGTLSGSTLNWVINVPSGTSVPVSFKVNVANDLTGVPTIRNTATVTDPNAPTTPQTPGTPDINTNQVRAFQSSKTVSTGLNPDGKIEAGATLVYKIRVENTGNVALTGITVRDTIPNGTSYDPADPDNTGVLDGNVVKWTIASIPYQGFAEVNLKLKVADNLTGIPSIANTAIVTDPNDPDNPQTPTDPPKQTDPKRLFTATKSISGLNANNKISPNSVLTFAITVANTGDVDLNGITISDPIPAGTTYLENSADKNGVFANGVLNWTLNVPFGTSEVVTFKVTVANDLTGITQIRNKATVTDPLNPTTPEEPESPPTDTEPVRSFTSTKSVSGLNPAGRIDANSELTYTISVKNTGNIALTGVTVADPIPTGTTYIAESANLGGTLTGSTLNWTIDVAVDQTVNLIFKVKVAADLTNIPSIGNTATITDPGNPGNPQTPTDPPKQTEQTPNYTLSSSVTTANPNGKAVAGEELTVTIEVVNTGNIALSNIAVTNPLPNNTMYKSTGLNGSYDPATSTVSFNLASLPVNSTATFTFKVDVNQNLVNVNSIDNAANVKANGLDKNTLASIGVVCPTTSVSNLTANGSTGGNICSNATNTVEIRATSSGVTNPVYYLYLNNVLDRQNNNGVFTLTLSAGNTYTYSVGISGTNYCETLPGDRKSITFTINQSPTAPGVPSANVTTCANVPVTLSVSNPNPAYTYSWYLSATGGTAEGTGSTFTTPGLSANTIYYVEANSGSCTSLTRTEVRVNVTTAPAAPTGVTVTNGPLCAGSAATLSVDNPQAGLIYRWYTSLSGGTSLGEGNIFTTGNLNSNTTFYVESSSIASGCASSTRFPVTVNVLPVLTAPVVILDSKTTNSITFRWDNVQNALSYEYTVDGGLSWQSAGTATSYTFTGLKPGQNVTISVRAVAGTACQNSAASAPLTANSDNPLGNEVFIPNTFTPNNDGNNDFFLVYGNTIKTINMRIYNQWGQVIFQSQQATNGWDGTYKGQSQPTGVYIYSVELTFNDGNSTTKKGTITLIR